MVESALHASASLCCVLGMAWLALAMKTHWQQVRSRQALPPKAQRRLRLLGATAIGSSLLLCLGADHPSMAVLVWVLTLAAGALSVAFTLTWRPSVLAPLVAWIPHSGDSNS